MNELRDEYVATDIDESTVVFNGAVWDVVEETFTLPGTTDQLTREVVRHPGAVAVAAVDHDNRILLMKQYRHPLRVFDWEIPAGLLDIKGEAPHLAAARELREEVDATADRWDVLADMMNSPGGSSETLRIYLAREITVHPAGNRTDEEALIEPRWVPIEEAGRAVLAGHITNATACLAILHCMHHVHSGFSRVRPLSSQWPAHVHAKRGLLGIH